MDPDKALAPLAEFAGARPPAPEWFERAIAETPERTVVQVAGAGLEVLAWGRIGAPGLLLLHGSGAHAGWWDHIAPFFSADWRVAAFSLAGMGGSGWREEYAMEQRVLDCFAVAEAAGLYEGKVNPVLVGHSLGAMIGMGAAGKYGERLRAAVMVDPPFRSPDRLKQWSDRRAASPPRAYPAKAYPTLAQALSRFRFMPPQTTDHLYIVDHIARGSLQEVQGGWAWRFDPALWTKATYADISHDLRHPKCPIALVHGERSLVAHPEDLAFMREASPPGTPVLMIPQAHHHLMVDQPLAFVAGLRGLLAGWPQPGLT